MQKGMISTFLHLKGNPRASASILRPILLVSELLMTDAKICITIEIEVT